MRFLLCIVLMCKLTCFGQEKPNSAVNKSKTILGEIDTRDKECFDQIAKAEKDFKSKELYFYIMPEGYVMSSATRHHAILSQLLTDKGIAFRTEQDLGPISIVGDNETYKTKTNCYAKTCNQLLENKYGKGFVKRMEHKADSLYVMSRINTPFEYPTEVDCYNEFQQNCLVYPKAKDFLEEKAAIKNDFMESFILPKGFSFKGMKVAFRAHCDFIINRDSSVSKINIDLKYNNPENAKYTKKIKAQIIQFIQKAQWQPATAAGITVNTRYEIVLSY